MTQSNGSGETVFKFRSLVAKKLPIIMDEGTPQERKIYGYAKPDGETANALPAQVQGKMADAQAEFVQAVSASSTEGLMIALIHHLQALVPDLTDEEAGLIIEDTEKGHLPLMEYLGFGDIPLRKLYEGADDLPSNNALAEALEKIAGNLRDSQSQSPLPASSETPASEPSGEALATSIS